MLLGPKNTCSPCTFGRTGKQILALESVPESSGKCRLFIGAAQGEGETRELKWFPSRDLLGSSYTETYSAANGSEVTEQLPGQVCAKTVFPGPMRLWQQDL